jgi:hypothetical protein
MRRFSARENSDQRGHLGDQVLATTERRDRLRRQSAFRLLQQNQAGHEVESVHRQVGEQKRGHPKEPLPLRNLPQHQNPEQSHQRRRVVETIPKLEPQVAKEGRRQPLHESPRPVTRMKISSRVASRVWSV